MTNFLPELLISLGGAGIIALVGATWRNLSSKITETSEAMKVVQQRFETSVNQVNGKREASIERVHERLDNLVGSIHAMHITITEGFVSKSECDRRHERPA